MAGEFVVKAHMCTRMALTTLRRRVSSKRASLELPKISAYTDTLRRMIHSLQINIQPVRAAARHRPPQRAFDSVKKNVRCRYWNTIVTEGQKLAPFCRALS